MPDKRLLAIVTVMMMVGTQGQAQQQPFSIAELRKIEALISGRDCGALYDYVASNPRLTFGRDPLAVELRSFQQEVETGRLECYSSQRLAFQQGAATAGSADVGRSATGIAIY
jgi:hypothetical protein